VIEAYHKGTAGRAGFWKDQIMFAVTGITGQVGGAVARNLLAAGHRVRAVVRDAKKGGPWADLGCEIAVADFEDVAALTAAFRGSEGVFLLAPPVFDPKPGFPEAHGFAAAATAALREAKSDRVVSLSTIGAQSLQPNLLSQHRIIESALRKLPMPVTLLRPAWFMENTAWDIGPARETGVLTCFLQPLDKPVPMVATADIGRVAAELLQQTWGGVRVVELEGPHRVTPLEIAATLAKLLGRPVTADIVARETWAGLFKAQGMQDPMPRIQMLDGFNEGWVEFEGPARKGSINLETALKALL
jgi:uncharacterized protein YbjT (DUF2867 family)